MHFPTPRYMPPQYSVPIMQIYSTPNEFQISPEEEDGLDIDLNLGDLGACLCVCARVGVRAHLSHEQCAILLKASHLPPFKRATFSFSGCISLHIHFLGTDKRLPRQQETSFRDRIQRPWCCHEFLSRVCVQGPCGGLVAGYRTVLLPSQPVQPQRRTRGLQTLQGP